MYGPTLGDFCVARDTQMKWRLWRPAVTALLSTWLWACSLGGRVEDQFYLLEPGPLKGLSPAGPGQPVSPRVGLAPVRIPGYIDRPQMVTALADNQYQLAETHRWAERLDENIERVLIEDLSRQLPTDQIVRHPSAREAALDALVSVQIQALHADATQHAVLAALWQVRGTQGRMLSRRFDCRLPLTGQGFGAVAAAENACLDRLARTLIEAVRDLLRQSH